MTQSCLVRTRPSAESRDPGVNPLLPTTCLRGPWEAPQPRTARRFCRCVRGAQIRQEIRKRFRKAEAVINLKSVRETQTLVFWSEDEAERKSKPPGKVTGDTSMCKWRLQRPGLSRGGEAGAVSTSENLELLCMEGVGSSTRFLEEAGGKQLRYQPVGFGSKPEKPSRKEGQQRSRCRR